MAEQGLVTRRKASKTLFWPGEIAPVTRLLCVVVQNLMLAALHGSSQGLVANIRRVLSELHRSKKLGGVGSVDGMLVRLYEPILFRALTATNAGVRRNALHLLLDAFPLLVRPTLVVDEPVHCAVLLGALRVIGESGSWRL